MNLTAELRTRLDRPGAVAELGLGPAVDDADRAGARVHVGAEWVLVGPWLPGRSDRLGDLPVCGDCVRSRWLRIRDDAERAVLAGSGLRGSEATWPPAPAFAVDAVLHTLSLIRTLSPPSPGDGRALLTAVHLPTLTTRTVHVEADPLCPTCAGRADQDGPADGEPFDLEPRPTPYPEAVRLCTPADYDFDDSALINPFCGIVAGHAHNDLASTTTAPVAGRLTGRSGPGSAELAWSGQRDDYDTSRRVGMLEGLERYAGSLSRRPGRPVVASFDTLRASGRQPVDPRVIGLYDDALYTSHPSLTRFDPATPIPWVHGWSLRDDAPVLVAERNVYYDGTDGPDRFVDECSNGCASGSCPEEAALHGLLEVIERDAFVLAWYSGRALPVIDIDAGLGPDVLAMIARAGLYGYDVTLLDNRMDLALPVVTALARRRDRGEGYLVLASGAAPDPLAAVRSALDEVLTYLPARATQVARHRPELERMRADFSLVRALRDHPELFGLASMAHHVDGFVDVADHAPLRQRFAASGSSARAGDLTEDLRTLVAELAAHGHDTVVVDQTAAEQARAGVSAVRVIVPGLLPIDFGWARQRALRMPRLIEATTTAPRLVPHPFP